MTPCCLQITVFELLTPHLIIWVQQLLSFFYFLLTYNLKAF